MSKRLASQSRERIVVVSAPIASHWSERRGGAAVATVIDGVCKDTDSRNSAGISLAPEAVRAWSGPIRPSDGRHRQGLGPPQISRPALRKPAIVWFPPANMPIRSPSDNPSLSVGFATLCPAGTQCHRDGIKRHATNTSILYVSPAERF